MSLNICKKAIDFIQGIERDPVGFSFRVIDHLRHNVYVWLFNFREIRYFDIRREYTALKSKAPSVPDGLVLIPLNEGGILKRSH